jgi:hypothetical protein
MRSVRRRAVWSLTLPVLILSEMLGHALVARVFDPHRERHVLLARTAQDSLEYLYAGVAICLVLAGATLVRRAVASFHGSSAGSLPSWQLAGVPSAAFLAQEQLESYVHEGQIGWLTAADPAVVVGALLQLPCGLLGVWFVRMLLRAADVLGYALGRRAERRVRERPAPQLCHGRQDAPLRLLPLACGLAERAPPSAA